MVEASGEGNGLSNSLSRKRQRSSEGNRRSAILDLDILDLDCPICFKSLTVPIFQCDNGHLACSTCCPKLRNKCPQCALPIGHSRCRAMESVVKSVFFPCPNADFGCTQNVTHGKETTHEKECVFSQFSCPVQDCNYTGFYKDLYEHYTCIHNPEEEISDWFFCDSSFTERMNISSDDKMVLVVKRDLEEELLYVLQCFKESYGVYVTVSCFAPSAPEVGEFSYLLTYSVDGHMLTYISPEVKKIKNVSSQIPQKNFMLIPDFLLCGESFDLEVSIKKVKKKT